MTLWLYPLFLSFQYVPAWWVTMNKCFIFSMFFLLLMMAGFSDAGDRERNSRRQDERMLHQPVQTASPPPIASPDTLHSGSQSERQLEALAPEEPQSHQPVSFVINTVSFDSQPAVEEMMDISMEQPVETEVPPPLDIPEGQSVEEITSLPELPDVAAPETSIAIGYYSEQTADVKTEADDQ